MQELGLNMSVSSSLWAGSQLRIRISWNSQDGKEGGTGEAQPRPKSKHVHFLVSCEAVCTESALSSEIPFIHSFIHPFVNSLTHSFNKYEMQKSVGFDS